MQIKLDSNTESAFQKLAREQGKTAEKLIEEMVKSQVQQQQPGSARHLPFATIYDTANGSWRFDADDPNLKDRVRQDVARHMMIARMQRGKHPVASELSEEQARHMYIERLRSRKSR